MFEMLSLNILLLINISVLYVVVCIIMQKWQVRNGLIWSFNTREYVALNIADRWPIQNQNTFLVQLVISYFRSQQ